MNKGHRESISTRLISSAFMVLAIAIFKPFGLEVWQWQAYVHLLAMFVLGVFSCFLTECVLRYAVRMPRSYDRGVNYIISRNLRFQCINTPLVSLLICLYRHFAMSGLVEGNKLSFGNYLETLAIIAFLSFAVGLYWRFKFRNRYMAAELEETRLLNEQLRKLQAHPSPLKGSDVEINKSLAASSLQTPPPLEGFLSGQATDGRVGETVTLEGSTNERITIEISNLLYIEAVGNYVKIVSKRGKSELGLISGREQSRPTVKVTQNHDGEVKTSMLRATMKQMEDEL